MSAPSLTDHIAPLDAGNHVVFATFLKESAALAMADGSILLLGGDGQRQIAPHPEGAILVATADGERLITGGDDGRIVATRADGSMETLAERKGKWIDAVAAKPDGSFAFSVGREVTANDGRGNEKSLSVPTTARGLAFSPKGYRLAISHYNGATLWFPNIAAAPELLDWKGSHLDVCWSSDARFVVTSMQENSLHGWRLLPDKNHMRMTGYPAKTRSFSWSGDGKWLATSGADAAIVWPFDSKEGPTGKAPRECGIRPARVSRVAFHPKALVLAVGYEDGCILLVRFNDASELLVRAATKDSPVTALSWDKHGKKLIFGCADGAAGLLTLPG